MTRSAEFTCPRCGKLHQLDLDIFIEHNSSAVTWSVDGEEEKTACECGRPMGFYSSLSVFATDEEGDEDFANFEPIYSE